MQENSWSHEQGNSQPRPKRYTDYQNLDGQTEKIKRQFEKSQFVERPFLRCYSGIVTSNQNSTSIVSLEFLICVLSSANKGIDGDKESTCNDEIVGNQCNLVGRDAAAARSNERRRREEEEKEAEEGEARELEEAGRV